MKKVRYYPNGTSVKYGKRNVYYYDKNGKLLKIAKRHHPLMTGYQKEEFA